MPIDSVASRLDLAVQSSFEIPLERSVKPLLIQVLDLLDKGGEAFALAACSVSLALEQLS